VATVGPVQQVDQGLHPADRGQVTLLQDRRQALLERALDRGDDVGRGAVHRGDPHRDVALQLLGEPAEHQRRRVGRHVGEHQGDGLGVLVADEAEHQPGIGLAEELEGGADETHRQAGEDLLGLALTDASSSSFGRSRHHRRRSGGGRRGDGELGEDRFDDLLARRSCGRPRT
jgi:hypothetical protein